MESSKVEEFLSGPLVSWFTSCLENHTSKISYDDLADGVLLNSIFLQIDPELYSIEVVASNGDSTVRGYNLEMILGKIKHFYEEKLGHLLVKLPDVANLGQEPRSYIEELGLLLLLIFGCAVQCEQKEKFFMNLETLDDVKQYEIFNCLKQVTIDQQIVITQDALKTMEPDDLFSKFKNLVDEKNYFQQKVKTLEAGILESLDNTMIVSDSENSICSKGNPEIQLENGKIHRCRESTAWKSKVRKLHEELDEQFEALMDSKAEIGRNTLLINKLNEENQKLIKEAKTANSHTDELNTVIEKAEKADQLEIENSRCREKLKEIDSYKKEIENLLEDQKILLNEIECVEDKLNFQTKRADVIPGLENEILKCRQSLEHVTLECAAEKEKNRELTEQNYLLRSMIKSKDEASSAEPSSDSEEPDSINNSLSDELVNNAQTQVRKLELENRRLLKEIESLKKNPPQEEDYAKLLQERNRLNTELQELKKKLQSSEKSYKKLELKTESLENKRETLQEEIESMMGLKREHAQLQADFKMVINRARLLNEKNKSEKNKLNQKLDELREELNAKEQKCSYLKSQNQVLNKYNQELLQANAELEVSKQKLMSHSHVLALRCKDFLEQTLEEKDNLDMERRSFSQTINHLNTQKRNLEEKIFEYYKTSPTSTGNQGKKSKSDFVRKVKKVGSDLFGRNRRSSSSSSSSFSSGSDQNQSESQIDFESIKNATEPRKIMTMDSRLPYGRRGKHDRFSLGNLERGNTSQQDQEKQLSESIFRENIFEPKKTMTLDRRLLSGKKEPRDRFASVNFAEGKVFHQNPENKRSEFKTPKENVNPSMTPNPQLLKGKRGSRDRFSLEALPSSHNKSFAELHNLSGEEFKFEQKSKLKSRPHHRSVFEVIKEFEDKFSNQDMKTKDKNFGTYKKYFIDSDSEN